MTAIVALLALATTTSPPILFVERRERLTLSLPPETVTLSREPMLHRLELRLPRERAAATARRLRGASRLCPDVEVGGNGVLLGCPTARVRADLDARDGHATLDLVGLTVWPWRPNEDGPPLVPFAPAAPDAAEDPDPADEGERLLAAGQLDAARRAFAAVGAAASGHAAIRLGDLALLSDAPEAAIAAWRQALGRPTWDRVAAARLCELDAECMASEAAPATLAGGDAGPRVHADAALRAARRRALAGTLLDALRALAPELGPEGACEAAPAWCRRLLLVGLGLPGAEGAEALAIYVEAPGRTAGALSLELAIAASRRAEAVGAPSFAANLLASVTGRIAPEELPTHLRTVAERYLAAGDRVRADEVLRFAQVHVPRAQWRRSGWSALERAIERPARPSRRPATAGEDRDLAAAEAAIQAARLAAWGPRGRR